MSLRRALGFGNGVRRGLPRQASLPERPSDLLGGREVARLVASALLKGEGGSLFRMGDTGGMILSRPEPGSPGFTYLQQYLGRALTREQAHWFADHLRRANWEADIIGLRSDLIGPVIDRGIFARPEAEVLPYLIETYPIRAFEHDLSAQSAIRLARTRQAIEDTPFKPEVHFTNAWVHVDLTEIGLISAILRESRSVAVVASRLDVVGPLAKALGPRLRFFPCPAHPQKEREVGGDHDFLWHRWQAIHDHLVPAYPGEPCLIAGGIWTKLVGAEVRRRGGYAIDFGSVMDYFASHASRPAVLADRYGAADSVPQQLTLDAQFARRETLEGFL